MSTGALAVVVLDHGLVYDGTQLGTAFMDRHAPGGGDAAVLFVGAADVPRANLVDLEDAEAGAFIYSPLMAHVVLEHRGLALPEAVWRQRLLVHLAGRWVEGRCGTRVEVRGDDLFVHGGKLSVSVATRSPRGALIHLGVNVETEGAPVAAVGLRDLRIPPEEFLAAVARLYADELVSVAHAAVKVRPVT
ncbi:MAG TPA: DUF366 family protein [Planctomycetota bacterium]|nr:DUF366 family protein [Planctomycetota bacterium]